MSEEARNPFETRARVTRTPVKAVSMINTRSKNKVDAETNIRCDLNAEMAELQQINNRESTETGNRVFERIGA